MRGQDGLSHVSGSFGTPPSWWIYLLLVLAAFNLRPIVISLGPLIDELVVGLGITFADAGVLLALPVVVFAVLGALAPWLATSFGRDRAMGLGMICIALGLGGRGFSASFLAFAVWTIIGLIGVGIVNVLLPSFVKAYYPERVGAATGLYAGVMAVGVAVASSTTAPIGLAAGSWRGGLLFWGFTAAIAVVPWLYPVVGGRWGSPRDGLAFRTETLPCPRITLRDVARTKLGWWLAIFFGFQSFQYFVIVSWCAQLFRDAGFSSVTSGMLFGLIMLIGIPISFVVPNYAGRLQSQRSVIVFLLSCFPLGYGMLILDPARTAVPAAILLGFACGLFPLLLALIGLRARTPNGTSSLSGFAQLVGYTIASVGPFLIGVLYKASGNWSPSLMLLIALVVPEFIFGILVSKERYVEDELLSMAAQRPGREEPLM